MKTCTISDFHIKDTGDNAYKLVLEFLNHSLTRKAERIIFLGDIFDFMVGDHVEYFYKFEEFFLKIKSYLVKGVEVHYFEGNHDFHLKSFFNKIFPKKEFGNFFFYHSKGEIFEEKNFKFYCCHGDDIEINNFMYKIYSYVVKSLPLNVFASYVLPYKIANYIGVSTSEKSRKYNQKKCDDKDLIEKKFRLSADRFAKKNNTPNLLIAGHSHCKDFYKSKLGYIYINNGYGPIEKCFIYFNKNEVKFVSIQ